MTPGEGKTGVPREKSLRARERTSNQLNPHYVIHTGSQTQAKLMGGEVLSPLRQPCAHIK